MFPIFGVIEGLFSPTHLIIVLLVGIILFGKRLPEMSRAVGKSVKEFAHGFRGLEDDLHGGGTPRPESAEPARPPQRVLSTAPKFEVNHVPPPPPPAV
jgi:sec-independent protein translocase protein TatA